MNKSKDSSLAYREPGRGLKLELWLYLKASVNSIAGYFQQVLFNVVASLLQLIFSDNRAGPDAPGGSEEASVL